MPQKPGNGFTRAQNLTALNLIVEMAEWLQCLQHEVFETSTARLLYATQHPLLGLLSGIETSNADSSNLPMSSFPYFYSPA